MSKKSKVEYFIWETEFIIDDRYLPFIWIAVLFGILISFHLLDNKSYWIGGILLLTHIFYMYVGYKRIKKKPIEKKVDKKDIRLYLDTSPHFIIKVDGRKIN